MARSNQGDSKSREKEQLEPLSKEDAKLLELVKEHEEKVWCFCFYMLPSSNNLDEIVLSIFRDFGDWFRRHHLKKGGAPDELETRLSLYRVGWEAIRHTILRSHYNWVVGRDTRQLKGLDDDLLKNWSTRDKEIKKIEGQVVERLARIDPELRAILVLRDVLGFEDEEAVTILGIRWGVYRHRLHRGRLELRDSLRGKPLSSEIKGYSAERH